MSTEEPIPGDKTDPQKALRELARQRQKEAAEGATEAFRLAKRHEVWEYLFAVVAAVSAASAAAAAVVAQQSAGDPKFWGIAALVLSAGASLGTFLNVRKVKNHHWGRRAVLLALAQSYEVIDLASEPPSKEEMKVLSGDWARGHAGLSD
jgi:peptidoglycan/LPS O-acetylase OafA/YrhL